MARVAIGQFAPTIGHAYSTYIADAESANDTIEAALAYHDVVFVRDGTFAFDATFVAPSNKTILGQPGNCPVWQMAAGTNLTVVTNANAGTGGFTTNVTMKSIIIDQQGTTQVGGGGIVVTGIQGWD